MIKNFIFLIFITLNLQAELIRDDDNQTVYDSVTKLTWQDNYTLNGDSVKTATWKEAIEYCETLTISGIAGWRLPNKNELFSLVTYTRTSPTLDNTKFLHTANQNYWTSSTNPTLTNRAWVVNFSQGYVNASSVKNLDLYVRCVKGGL